VRRFSLLELATLLSLSASLAAVAVPAFVRNVHASRLSEPVEGLHRLGACVVEFTEAEGHLPASAPMTPHLPPRGVKAVDPTGTWDIPEWNALRFAAAPEGVPHAYSFSLDSHGSGVVARARGDLDGDGVLSTFELRGSVDGQHHVTLEPGLHVEEELE
jgi:hypothetical protein